MFAIIFCVFAAPQLVMLFFSASPSQGPTQLTNLPNRVIKGGVDISLNIRYGEGQAGESIASNIHRNSSHIPGHRY